MREARRWLDELAVRSINGRMCERRPGERLLTYYEGAEIHRRALEELPSIDPELNKAVRRVLWEHTVDSVGITMEQWRIEARRSNRHMSKVRAEMQRAGSI